MPLVSSSYQPPLLFRNGHIATIYSAKLRKAPKVAQNRFRIHTSDGDFMDIDYSRSTTPSNQAAILLHGLEGHAQRSYMQGQAHVLIHNGWDVFAVNYRGCSGETNRVYASYNAGKTDDLEAVVNHVLELDRYQSIALIGFSLGGNLLLKYLGERDTVPSEIRTAVAISTPVDLKASLQALEQWYNYVYRTSFLINLRKKYRLKMSNFPDKMHPSDLKKIRSLKAFDDIYTAPAHGFTDAYDYYKKNSSLQFLPNISIPILIINALNDSFLTENCYPFTLGETSKNIYLETPKFGGHVGFHKTDKRYYSEERALRFLTTKH